MIPPFQPTLLRRGGTAEAKGAMASLTDGLARLRESAVNLARSDAREVLARFGRLGDRKLALAG
ncbi:MAG: hypothetical protein NTW21_10990 [Verrucomicrobia bacterium]|nr:hypothetical protein [Verrucomicrobiota bacterium]